MKVMRKVTACQFFYQNNCTGNEVVLFGSLCGAWEKDEVLFTMHMVITHYLPPLKDDLCT